MFCTKCGVKMDELVRYCSQCGSPTGNVSPSQAATDRKLARPYEGRKIAGVCAGLGRYWGVDPVLVRILFAALAIYPALPAVIPYIVCWIIMPNDPIVAVRQEPVAVV